MQKLYRLFIGQSLAVQIVLLLGFLVQLITCFTAVGFFHPDQHYQIIEFSSYQLQLPNATNHIWELQAHIRSTIQVYMFSGFTSICKFLFITDVFTQTTILRVINGTTHWWLFNIIALVIAQKQDKKSALVLLIIINFSWIFPYTRTLFNSEMLSSFVFFGTVFWYSQRYLLLNNFKLILVGILLAIAFYIRFQFAFGIIGFGFFVLLHKQFKHIVPLLLGFFIGVLANTAADFLFYKQWVCTPYLYFTANITQGKASEFGEENFTYYITVLLATFTILPISLVVSWHWLKASLSNLKNIFVLIVVCFLVGHMLVAHKEERFMFPILQLLPLIMASRWSSLLANYHHPKKIIQYCFRVMLWLSIGLNTLLLILFMFIPYAQTLHFASLLNKAYTQKEIVCLQRTPLETESLAPYTFYENNKVTYKKIVTNDSLLLQKPIPTLVATTFNQAKDNLNMLDSLGYKPILYSNKTLWELNLFLHKKKANTINDIWVLYKR